MELGLKAQGRKLGATLSCCSIHKPEAGPVAIGRMIKRKKKNGGAGQCPGKVEEPPDSERPRQKEARLVTWWQWAS